MRPNGLLLSAAMGALTVALGAFGAHGLADRLAPDRLELWHTAVLYQGLHAPALGLAGLLQLQRGRGTGAVWAFLIGTVVFSGTVYGLALGAPKFLGAITPIGGVALIVGWLALGKASLGLAATGAGPAGPAGGPAANPPGHGPADPDRRAG